MSYSNPFYVIAYTDKRADNADLIVGQESDLTATNIFSKLKIDTTSGYPTTNPSLTVPETEYTRTIVGYRLTGTNDVQNLSADTLNTLPAGGNYEIKVKTTNQYGQTIYNWVPVNDTRTKEVSKEDLFVFNNSPIQTVDGTNKVKVVTVEDKDGVQAIDYYQSPSNVKTDLSGVEITLEKGTGVNQVDGYVTGTPNNIAIGFHSRAFGVTDAKGNLVIAYPNVSGGEDKRQFIHVMDTNVTGSVTKQAGEIPTKEEILTKVTVNYGTPHKKITNPTSMYSMDLAPDQKVPTDPGEYDVKVRVVTASNVYKDVTVKVIIPKYSDVLTARADENTSLVPGSGAAATQPITFTKEEVVDGQKTNVATTAPAGTAYAVEQKFLSEKQALGYEISVSETGEVSVKAPAGQEVDITVPVTVAYPDNSTDTVNVLFKVNQKDLAQIEAKKAIDDKLAEVIKELEAKRDATIAEIDDNIELTDVQKEAAKNAITAVADNALKDLDTKATEAKEKIDKATTASEINDAKTNGEINLDSAEAVGEKAINQAKEKELAKAEVENEAFEALEKVNNNPNLLEEEKKAYFDDIKESKEVAVEKINNAGNTDEITAAIDEAEIAYNEDVINAAQLDALNKLEKDSEETKAAIDANPNLTPEEKAKAIAKVEELVNNAESDILSKPTPETVQAVEDKADKDLAKVELQAAADDAKKGIEANPNLTPEEKDVAKKAVEDAVKVATDAIDKASTPIAVQAEEHKGVAAINLITAKADAKGAVAAKLADEIKKLKDKQAEAEKAIDASTMTNEEKAIAKKALQDVVDKGKADLEDAARVATNEIHEATTTEKAKAAELAGEKSLTDTGKEARDAVELAKDKELAKEAIRTEEEEATKIVEKLAEDTRKAIEDNPNLSDEDKQAEIKKLTDAVAKTLETIRDNATTAMQEAEKAQALADLEKAKETQKIADKAAIDRLTILVKDGELEATKQDAKNKIAKDAAAAKEAIGSNPNLTDAEKKTFTDAVDAEVAKANDAISAATSPADVQKEEDAGVAAIAEDVLDAAKQDAKNKIAKESAAAKSAIDANPNLTPEEKESAKKAIDTDAQAATAAIDKASTPDAVQVEEDKGVAAINLITAKADAKGVIAAKLADEIKKLEDKQAEAEKAIDASTMTNEEKAIAKKALQDVVDKGKAELEDAARVATNEIHKATTAEDAKAATLAGEKSLTDTGKEARDAVEWAKDKELAKEAIRTEEEEATRIVEKLAENALKAINSDPNLSDEDKQAEIKKLTDVVTKTLETIHDNATKATQEAEKTQALADLEKVKETQKIADKAAIDGLTSLVKDGELEAMKQDAKNKIAKDAAAAKEAIGSNPNLTDAEKKTFTDAVDAEVAKANDAISAATSPADVQKEEDAGVAAIAEDVLDAAKQDAKNKIAKEVDAAKEAIDANPNLSDAEKEASKKAVDADAKAATDAIDASTSPVEAQSAEDKGVGSIAQDVLDAAKQDAKNKIAKEAESAKSVIDSNPNLTDAEKAAAKKAVDADAKAATDAIDASTSPVEAQSAEDKGVGAIAQDVLDAAKQDAKNKIAKEAESAKSAIDSNPNLTDAEKESAKKAVDADAKVATDAIAKASTPDAVQAEEDKGVGAIAQDVLDAAKQDAKNKIAKEAESAKSVIDSNPNLTDAAKEAAKSEIDKAVEEAIVLINGVRTHQELEKIKLPMAALIKPAAKVTPVVDPNNLTEKEIARIKAFLKENNNLPEGTEINVSKDASVTIKYPDGTIDLLSPVEVVKQADKTAPTVANDGKGNIVIVPSEKAVEIVISYVDNNGKPQTVVVTKGTDGLWTASNTVVIVDPVTGQVIVPGSVIKPGTVVTAYSKDEVGNSSDSAEAEVVAVDENNSAAGVKVKSVTTNANNVEKKAKQLPNTGEEANSATSLGLVALGLGLALLAAKRRRDEEA
ncbi:TPA: DUF1542 domain-containing protein [Streptococcus suis]|nr:DUF1542 domain-containing protein [Streptococcus suis]